MFQNREHAARALADALRAWKGKNPLVLAIPRGAVPMGNIIAQRLKGELDIVLTRKLGAPGQAEFAIGAVEESGRATIEPYAGQIGATEEYIAHETGRQLQRMRKQRERYTGAREPVDPAGRIVIVVDDGLATGSTMIATLNALRAKNPRRLICAVPVAPSSTAARVAAHCDDLVCLDEPYPFRAVGEFYQDFSQVEDEEVIAALRAAHERHAVASSGSGAH